MHRDKTNKNDSAPNEDSDKSKQNSMITSTRFVLDRYLMIVVYTKQRAMKTYKFDFDLTRRVAHL